MPRKARIDAAGAFHSIIVRGKDNQFQVFEYEVTGVSPLN